MTTDDRIDESAEKEHADVRGYEGDVAATRTVISPTMNLRMMILRIKQRFQQARLLITI
jgi:hypothetical protein